MVPSLTKVWAEQAEGEGLIVIPPRVLDGQLKVRRRCCLGRLGMCKSLRL